MCVIQIRNLSKKFKHNIIFNKVNLELEGGNIYIFKGQNGIGKSTFLKCICGLINYQGTIKYHNKICYLPERVILPPYQKVKSFLKLLVQAKLANLTKEEKIDFYLERYKIQKYQDKYIKTLSLGTKQKILIIQSLIIDADIYLFDEPLNGLDLETIKLFKEELLLLKEKKKLIIMISHEMSSYHDLIHKTLIINNGEINVV